MKTNEPISPVQGFKRPRAGKVASNVADWTIVDPKRFVELVAVASAKGAALRFGYTRDGGAYSVGVYVGGDYFTDYLRPDEDIDEYVKALLESFGMYIPAVSNPPEKRKSSR